MTENFWQRALPDTPAHRALQRSGLLGSPTTEPEQPEPVDVGSLSMDEFSQHRGELGIGATSDFLGVQGWSREQAVRPVYHLPTPMEEYAAQREQLGVKDAPASSAMQGIREFTRAQNEAAQINSPRKGQ